MRKKVFSLFALMLFAATGALAQGTVTIKEGTADADKWTVKSGTTTVVLGETEVAKDATVTATYSGTRHVKSVTAVVKGGAEETVTLATPLTLEALSDGTIVVKTPKSGMQYTLNGGTKTAVTEDAISVTAGDKVQFYGQGTTLTSYYGTKIAGGTAQTKVYGNIMSLVDETGYATNYTTLSGEKVFYGLFLFNSTLTDASGLLLPATTLVESCYAYLFRGCDALTAAPELPATILTESCYYNMFTQCAKLNAVTCLATDISASYCTDYWLTDVSATGTLTTPASTAWTTNSESGIPTGWTRVNAE